MNELLDLLIGVLEEAKTWGTAEQVGAALFFLTTFIFGPPAFLWARMRARESRLARDAAIIERDLGVANKARTELRLENERLARFEPRTVLRNLMDERRDQNRSNLVRIADGYMVHHRDAFAATCRILADHQLSRYEGGGDALQRARTAAMGALAAAPEDRDLAALLDEIEALQRVESQPPTTQEEARQHEERERLRQLLRETPEDVEALRAVDLSEFVAGRYRSANVFWGRAEEALLSKGHDGSDDPLYLLIRLDLGRANLSAGRLAAARDIIAPLPDRCAQVNTPSDTLTLSARKLLAELLCTEGATDQAERGLRDLIPLMEQVLGEEHPNTLSARRLLAVVVRDQGRAKESEGLLRDLLPLEKRCRATSTRTPSPRATPSPPRSSTRAARRKPRGCSATCSRWWRGCAARSIRMPSAPATLEPSQSATKAAGKKPNACSAACSRSKSG